MSVTMPSRRGYSSAATPPGVCSVAGASFVRPHPRAAVVAAIPRDRRSGPRHRVRANVKRESSPQASGVSTRPLDEHVEGASSQADLAQSCGCQRCRGRRVACRCGPGVVPKAAGNPRPPPGPARTRDTTSHADAISGFVCENLLHGPRPARRRTSFCDARASPAPPCRRARRVGILGAQASRGVKSGSCGLDGPAERAI